MRIAAGFKAHSGWVALVVVGFLDGDVQLIDRRRIELVDPEDADWAKQPYHAADELPPAEARRLVERAIKAANRVANREMSALLERTRKAGHELIGCAVLVGSPMPEWTIDQIRSVHVRMHKAEGMLFPAALSAAVVACDLGLTEIPEKELRASDKDATTIARLGKTAGPPWGKDQKNAALAAMSILSAS
ncbi:MAG: hypothetical protein ACRD3J_11340 [Thermoanaerobaculia bacterium]